MLKSVANSEFFNHKAPFTMEVSPQMEPDRRKTKRYHCLRKVNVFKMKTLV